MDPVVRAALAITHKPGAYAVLAGAGLSAASQVPQAWQVQQDLIRQVAATEGEDPEDAFAWWHQRFGEQATYDGVLGAVARTPAERRAQLEPFFEPDDDDRQHGRKLPSSAHRALARLVAAGQVRIIVTTNFDMLIEAALREVGVEPVVISNPAQLAGMEPLHAQRALVVHLHGSYLDPELLNTTEELGAYPEALDRLLDRVLEEYGLLVVGWSARWDLALRRAVGRCPARRYSTWWVDAFALSAEAEELAAGRDADVVIADGATWLGRLADACEALAEDRLSDPLTVSVAVRSAKRELAGAAPAISLHDAIRSQIEHVRHLPVLDPGQSMDGVDAGAEHARRLEVLEAQIDVLLALVGCAAYWGSPATDRYWLEDIARFAEPADLSGIASLIHLLWAPAMLLLHTAGVAAAAAQRDDLVAQLLVDVTVPDPVRRGRYPAASLLDPGLVYSAAAWPAHHLQERLRPLLAGELGLGDDAYDAAWQRWSYLIGVTSHDPRSNGGRWRTPTRLLVKRDPGGSLQLVIAPAVKGPIMRVWNAHPLLQGGLCAGQFTRFASAAKAFEHFYSTWADDRDHDGLPADGGFLPTGPYWPQL